MESVSISSSLFDGNKVDYSMGFHYDNEMFDDYVEINREMLLKLRDEINRVLGDKA